MQSASSSASSSHAADAHGGHGHDDSKLLGLTVGAIGVVYGDVGTSPLYAFREALHAITEHGVAYLHGKTIRQRAEAMIAIADPRFQPELEAYAIRSKLLTASRNLVTAS